MGRRRTKDRDMPPRVTWRNGAWHWRAPESARHLIGGKTSQRLGKTKPEALKAWAELVAPVHNVHTMADLITRYMTEVAPNKAERTYNDNIKQSGFLRGAFGNMAPDQIEPQHIYQAQDVLVRTKGATQARQIMALLSHMFTKGIEWGALKANPMTNKGVVKPVQKRRHKHIPARAEYNAVLALATPLVACVMELARITALRQGDLLSLQRADCKRDGILKEINKSKRYDAQSPPKAVMIKWTPELRKLVDKLKRLNRPANPDPDKPAKMRYYVISNRKGYPYSGDGFRSLWTALMKKAKAAGVTPGFEFHAIRKMVANEIKEARGLEAARDYLTHSSATTTQDWYLDKVTVITPLGE